MQPELKKAEHSTLYVFVVALFVTDLLVSNVIAVKTISPFTIFGHEFVLISSSAGAIAVPLTPMTYVRAVGELAAGGLDGHYLRTVTTQLSGWLSAQPRLPVARLATLANLFFVLRVSTLVVTAILAMRTLRSGGAVTALAWTALVTPRQPARTSSPASVGTDSGKPAAGSASRMPSVMTRPTPPAARRA